MNSIKQHILCATLCLVAGFGYAQTGQITEGEVFVGDAERNVPVASKLSDIPEMYVPEVEQLDVKFNFLNRQVETNFMVDMIAPAKLTGVEPLDQIYNGYVKAGIGLYTMPYLDFYYGSGRSRTEMWGINLKHFSSSGGVKDRGDSRFSQTGVHLFGKKFLRNVAIGGSIDYNRDAVRYYGYDAQVFTDWDKDNTRQVFNYIGGSGFLTSYYKDSTAWNYEAALGYYHLADQYDTKENNIQVDGLFKKFLKNNLLLLGFQLDFNNYQYMSDSLYDVSPGESFYDNTILTINPKISSRGPKWKADAGLKIVMDADHTANFKFYPDVEFKYSLFNDVFVPYIGIVGGVERNSYKTLTDVNPFVRPDLTLGEDMLNTNNKFQFYGGIRGTLSSALSFNLGVSQGRFVNMPLFVSFPGAQDTLFHENRFFVEYDTVDVFGIKGEITYQRTEKLSLFLKGEYFNYSTTFERYAWNKPDYQLTLSGIYNIWDKLYVKANMYGVGPRKAKSFVGAEGAEDLGGFYAVDMEGYFDADIGFEYRYTTRLSAFINFNNILGQRYDMWYQYPVQGFNLLGGVTYSF